MHGAVGARHKPDVLAPGKLCATADEGGQGAGPHHDNVEKAAPRPDEGPGQIPSDLAPAVFRRQSGLRAAHRVVVVALFVIVIVNCIF